jgi:predicted ABC-type ATPase
MSALLRKALAAGIEVRIWFVGLSSPELHMARVRSRVARGGHDIPDTKIRERYGQSRINLIELMPRLTELRVFDNSVEADPHAGRAPRPTLVLHLAKGKIVKMVNLAETPQWARALVAAAVKISK